MHFLIVALNVNPNCSFVNKKKIKNHIENQKKNMSPIKRFRLISLSILIIRL